MSLEQTRQKINTLDADIVRLLDLRAAAGREAADYKKKAGLPLRNVARENEVVARIVSLSNGSMPEKALTRIYRTIIAETLAQESGGDSPVAACGSRAPNGAMDVAVEVMENYQVADVFFLMRLHAPCLAAAFSPGQFFQLRIRGEDGVFLRRPFAPSGFDTEGFSFVYAVVGSGTQNMTRLLPGAMLSVLAPLGNGFTLPDAGAHAVLIGGGCGTPSLTPLAAALRANGVRVTAVIGARSADLLVGKEGLASFADRVLVATDDGTLGCRGTTIDACRMESKLHPDHIFACGPVPMLRAVAALAGELGVPCQVSLEERMACGFGACMGCAVPVVASDGFVYRRVCHEGPVFRSVDLAWDEIR